MQMHYTIKAVITGKHTSPHKASTKRAIFQTYSLNLIYTKIHEKYFSKLTVKTVFLNEKLLISSELRDATVLLLSVRSFPSTARFSIVAFHHYSIGLC